MDSTFRSAALAAVLGGALAGCSTLDKVECQPGYDSCNGVCVALASDARHCGGCGRACGAEETCAAGACVRPCSASLHAPILDSWGFSWDGLERRPAPYQAARDACASVGARLPTTSELYRVSTHWSGEVGDNYATHPIWSLTPHDENYAYAVVLSDWVASGTTMTTPTAYRCVCPPPQPAGFDHGDCYAWPWEGGRCWVPPNDPRLRMDPMDRPWLSKSGALFECALAGGTLPTFQGLAGMAMIGDGANGSGAPLHTADDEDRQLGETIVWLGTTVTSSSSIATDSALRYRCVGFPGAIGVRPQVADTFAARAGKSAADLQDRPATPFTLAIDACFADGGHLPQRAELASLAQQGLPRDQSPAYLWAADQMGFSTYWYASTYRWNGVADWSAFAGSARGVGYAGGNLDWARKDNGSQPFRCAYTAFDPGFASPADCLAPCWTSPVGAARVWIDGENRPATRPLDAFAACARRRGHVVTARDLTEAIRRGLPGNNATVMTASFHGPVSLIGFQWAGSVNPTFTDSAGLDVSLASTTTVYRCAWTSELRTP